MELVRIKQGIRGIDRKFGVHGRALIKSDKFGERMIYTLESPWNYNKDEENGIVGLSCIAQGSYNLTVEKSPIDGKEYPFVFNEKFNVCLKAKVNVIDRTGYCFYPGDGMDPMNIYGRHILCGTKLEYRSQGYYLPTFGNDAISLINAHIKESGDKKITIKWID